MNSKKYGFWFIWVVAIMLSCKTTQVESKKVTYNFRIISQHTHAHLLFGEKKLNSLKQITLPTWEGCSESQFKRGAFTDCTRRNLEQFINETLEIPEEALSQKIEGHIEYHFVLQEDGTISKRTIEKNPGSGLGEALDQSISQSTQLRPATINGKDAVATKIQLKVFCDIVLR